MKWKLKYLFLLLFASFWLFSSAPAQAFELTTEVKATGNMWRPQAVRCKYSDGGFVDRNDVSCGLYGSTGAHLTQIIMINPSIPLRKGFYYRFTLTAQWPSVGGGNTLLWTPYTVPEFVMVNLVETVAQEPMPYTTQSGGVNYTPYSKIFDITLKSNVDTASGLVSMGEGTNQQALFYISSVSLPQQAQAYVVMGQVYEYEEYDSGSAINNQQQDAGEQAQSDGNQASNQAQSDADQATATIFQTLGDIVGAFKDTPATDCTINGDLGHVNMGTLNFCQGEIGPLRPIIRAVLYLAMSVATYKILMWVVGAIAGLVNWVQTGGKE